MSMDKDLELILRTLALAGLGCALVVAAAILWAFV